MTILNYRADVERSQLRNLPRFIEIAMVDVEYFRSRWVEMEVNQFDIQIIKEAIGILLKPYWIYELSQGNSSDGELAWTSALHLRLFLDYMEEHEIPRETFYD